MNKRITLTEPTDDILVEALTAAGIDSMSEDDVGLAIYNCQKQAQGAVPPDWWARNLPPALRASQGRSAQPAAVEPTPSPRSIPVLEAEAVVQESLVSKLLKKVGLKK